MTLARSEGAVAVPSALHFSVPNGLTRNIALCTLADEKKQEQSTRLFFLSFLFSRSSSLQTFFDMPASNASATVVADNDYPSTSRPRDNGKGKSNHLDEHEPLVAPPSSIKFLTQTVDPLSAAANRQFFVPINEANGGLVVAIQTLHEKLLAAGKNGLISKKKPFSWAGRKIEPGFAGFYDHGGLPKIILTPGRYPGLPLANWWARKWSGVLELSSTVLSFNGFVSVQVSQNQAAVIADPANQIFVLKNGGFVSLSVEGSYRVLGVVDGVNLRNEVIDPLSGGREQRVLGHYEEVSLDSNGRKYVVATFLDIPANNCVILQKGDELEQLPAGQHYITNPSITVRGWFSKGESQLEMKTPDCYTKDQVPVQLKIYLRWQLLDPIKLCYHGYATPYAAIQDKTLSCLTQVVSHLEYASLLRQRGFATGDDARDGPEPDSTPTAFLDAVRTQALDELHEAAKEYGIMLKEVAVLDRNFKGQIAQTMDTLTTRSLQAQVEASNVDRENSNRVKVQEGLLQVARVQAQQRKTEADAAAYSVIANAKAEAEAVQIAALGEAEAIRVTAEAEAKAIAMRNEADRNVKDDQARAMQMARNEVQRIAAYGNKAIFVPTESGVAGNVLAGFALTQGGAATAAKK
ncbi:hypothetical protein BCR35DRAFT_19376 [Leucosporidium creatinivorum]|uniref:Band 7 domain-containing protein n=1 Tax=Leucosporidium creatinivorum TaxID=106004 RepID=A0A1Y2CYR2_9BASI|nr:hypothetical protein BCR35DRAFT_19376 [Leucosporidium creatinivorum]